MQRFLSLTWAAGPLAVLLGAMPLFTSCMSLRHKVDPVSITLNVKLEEVEPGKEGSSQVKSPTASDLSPVPGSQPAAPLR